VIHHGDCLEVMAGMEPESVDAICTDPPYGLEFMGKEWDKITAPLGNRRGGTAKTLNVNGMTDKAGRSKWVTATPAHHYTRGLQCTTCGRWQGGKTAKAFTCECARPNFVNRHRGSEMQAFHARWAEAAYRVAKPSAYLLAFGGTRTVHRMTVALEDAGWIIRDMLCWGFASGFPKSKASLKPAYEPIVWAQKPLRVMVDSWGEIHHGLAALVWLTEGAPDGPGCVAERVASLFADSDETGTSRSRAVASTSSSIASSWGSILAAFSDDGSRSTTSTATSPTTVLRTLNSCLSPVISASTMPPCGCLRDGSSSPAATAASSSSDEHMSWLATLRRSVPESAIGPLAQSVAGVCAAIAADPSGDQEAASTAPDPAITRPAGSADWEPIVMARKPGPLRELAIDACRIGTTEQLSQGAGKPGAVFSDDAYDWPGGTSQHPAGRWPANVILTDEVFGDTYSRFFLIPKADRADREPVLGGLPERHAPHGNYEGRDLANPKNHLGGLQGTVRQNHHPTVKPTDLMRHLVRLVTPTGGTVLDPFGGSGTTALAAEMEGFPWILIERELEYVQIAEARLNGTQRGLGLETA
jgi:DNA modification methylase